MSGFLSLPSFGNVFNRAGSAGPRRLAFIGLGIVAIVGSVLLVASIRPSEPVTSRPGPLPRVNPLPGGLHSNPQQDVLSVIDNQEKAARAQQAGNSYTPVMPASRPYSPPIVTQAAPQAALPSPRPQPAQASVAPPQAAAAAMVTQVAPARLRYRYGRRVAGASCRRPRRRATNAGAHAAGGRSLQGGARSDDGGLGWQAAAHRGDPSAGRRCGRRGGRSLRCWPASPSCGGRW